MLVVNGYSETDLRRRITSSNPAWEYAFYIVSESNVRLHTLTTVVQESTSFVHDETQDIIRQVAFDMNAPERFVFDKFNHRFEVVAMLPMPARGDDDSVILRNGEAHYFAQWTLGIFVPSTYHPKMTAQGKQLFSLECDDMLHNLLFETDKVFQAAADTTYDDAFRRLFVDSGYLPQWYYIEPTGKTFSAAREWDKGTPRVEIVKELCKDIAFTYYADEKGVVNIIKWTPPMNKLPTWEYAPSIDSIIYTELDIEDDSLRAVNYVYGEVQLTEQVAGKSGTTTEVQRYISAERANINPNDPTSVPNRRIRIPYFLTGITAPDQQALQDAVDKKLFELTQKLMPINWKSGANPIHGFFENIKLSHPVITADTVGNVNYEQGVYRLIKWSQPLTGEAEVTRKAQPLSRIS